MYISNITPSQVWSASSRSLTNFGGALTSNGVASTSLPGAAAVDLRPSVAQVLLQTIAVVTGAAATGAINIQLFDGTSTFVLATTAAAANSFASFNGVNGNPVGYRLLNGDATHAGFYATAAATLSP